MSINTGGPAFPVPMFSIGHAKYEAQQQGLTLRDYFAAKAMQGMLAAAENHNTDELAVYAFDVADAMLKAREASNG